MKNEGRIKLYGMSSPNVRKVVIALEEIGLDYDVEHVPVMRGRQFDDAFIALNPMAKVPVIIDRSERGTREPIFESGAILIYLAELYEPRFLPLSGTARWEVLKWLMMQMANVGPALGHNSHFRLIASENVYASARFRRIAAQVYHVLDAQLADRPFIGGNDYSVADMAVYPWARYSQRHGMDDQELPHLTAWKSRIAVRPAVVRAATVMRAFGEQDTLDRSAATAEEWDRFLGLHIEAPSAERAANVLPGREWMRDLHG